jgi:hypothetical protein
MLWDLYQQYRIGQLDRRLDRVQDTSTRDSAARDAVVGLEEKLSTSEMVRRMAESPQRQSVVPSARR